MSAYYNENDPRAAAWLRELIAQGHIAPGYVDERSITEVRPTDLAGFVQCHFFAGIGVWSAALRGSGWRDDRPVWTGSCPCQPFSAAGKGEGIHDRWALVGGPLIAGAVIATLLLGLRDWLESRHVYPKPPKVSEPESFSRRLPMAHSPKQETR